MITVHPCFHWIGYHISTGLLQEGMEVIGIDQMNDLISEHLYMHVGRNSNFQHFYNKEDKEKHVHSGAEETVIQYMDHQLLIEKVGEEADVKWIELPILYGEWMDVASLEIRNENELFQWVKDHEAVYITDYLKEFIPSILDHNDSRTPSSPMEDSVEDAQIRNVEAVWKTHLYARTLGF